MDYELVLIKKLKDYEKGKDLVAKSYISLAEINDTSGLFVRWFTLKETSKKLSDEYFYKSQGWAKFDFKSILKLRDLELNFIKEHYIKDQEIDWKGFEDHVRFFNTKSPLAPFSPPNLFWLQINKTEV